MRVIKLNESLVYSKRYMHTELFSETKTIPNVIYFFFSKLCI